MARPSKFTAEIGDAICERIADGESLRSICREDGAPDKATVFRWLGEHEAFRDQYARAREAQADSYADDIADIADDKALDPNDKRVRIDARKWLAGKLRPKRYGEKIVQEHSGPEGAPLTQVVLFQLPDNGRDA